MRLITQKSGSWKWLLPFIFAVTVALWLFRDWQPERQVRLHQEKFLAAVEDHNWKRVQGLLADDYQDRFQHHRDSAIADLREVLRQFFVLNIRPQGTRMQIDGPAAVVTCNLTISGTGTGATDLITTEMNRLPEPWQFFWRKTGAFPWNWQLEKVDNAALPASFGQME